MTDLTFQTTDKFDRKAFADRLTSVIKKFYPFYDEAFVLSLNARYGAGKTTFLRMWQADLQEQGLKVFYINAWETDFEDEPLLPLLSALLDGIGHGKGTKKLKGALQGTIGATALIGNKLLEQTTGINVKEIMEDVEADLKASDIQKVGEEIYKEYSFKKESYLTLKAELSKYLENLEQKPLVIFIDELDRVRPDYAVRFLEAIKHIFSLQGIFFVIAIDRKQLEASVRQLYGEIDFENYYLRFITREAQLPEVKNIKPFIQLKLSDFFDEKRKLGVSFPFRPEDQGEILEFISKICTLFRFVPRQIQTFFRIFSQFMAISSFSDTAARKSWIFASSILIAIFIDNRDLYNQIGNSLVPPRDLFKYIQSLGASTDRKSDRDRILLTVLAFSLREGQQDELAQIASLTLEIRPDLGNQINPQQTQQKALDMLAKWLNDWGDIEEVSAFRKIYLLLEDWRSFIE